MKAKKELEEIIVCDCGSLEHQMVIQATNWGDDDPDSRYVYVDMYLAHLPFWKRLWYGIKYICGYKCKYGAFEEIILKPEDAYKFEKVVEWLKKCEQ